MLDLNLENKNALVCGASQGIGYATAVELAEHGANVIVLARNEEKLKALVDNLPCPHNQQHDYIACDLADLKTLERKITQRLQESAIEILVNNAGGPKPGPIVEATPDQFDAAMRMHLHANVVLTNCLLPGMREKQYGRIINIISTSVKSPIETLGVSNTVRWAVSAWSKTLSYEVAKDGVTVNNVLPGFIETKRLQTFVEHQAKLANLDYDTMYSKLRETVPAKRIGVPREMAQAIVFLASPAAAYINGVALAIDGGRTHVL